MPVELPHVSCRHIDTDLPADDRARPRLADQLLAEIASPADEVVVALRRGKRWVPTFTPVHLDGADGATAGWRERGVYLVTGGLGGIGLSMAQHLAQRVQARLVLVGRSAFPPPESWDGWLAGHETADRTRRTIQALRRMEADGAEVLVLAADVRHLDGLRAVRRRTLERFGRIDGIIHAAGVPGGGMIEVKDRTAAESVMGPKLEGTIALAEVFGDLDLDAFVLCSSVTGIAGGFGQVDYCGANAFMDAYARSPRAPRTRMVSVNWGGWLEVGMAAESQAPAAFLELQRGGHAIDADHPWLQTVRDAGDGAVVAGGVLSPERHWVLDEHRIHQVAVLPGTGHLELARAALAAADPRPDGDVAVDLQDTLFLVPLSVADGSVSQLEVAVDAPLGDGDRTVTIRTRDAEGRNVVHARTTARWLPVGAPPLHDLDAIRARCPDERGAHTPSASGMLTFGPRWSSLRRIWVGDGEELAYLQASDQVAADMAGLGLHPAVLDEATAFGTAYGGEGQYLPMGYGELLVRSAIPAGVYSHLRYKDGGGDDMRLADITLIDPDGREVVAIRDFMLRRVDDQAMARSVSARADGGQPGPDSAMGPDSARGNDSAAGKGVLGEGTGPQRVGIAPAAGAEALRRLLAVDLGPQVVVSAVSIEQVIASTRQLTQETLDDELESATLVAVAADRSNLGDYVAPTNGLQEQLAELWADVVGMPQVGTDDDFFDLGGNSLVAVQLVSRVRDTLGHKLSMRSLFEAPTVAGMAAAIEAQRRETAPHIRPSADTAPAPAPSAALITRLARPQD